MASDADDAAAMERRPVRVAKTSRRTTSESIVNITRIVTEVTYGQKAMAEDFRRTCENLESRVTKVELDQKASLAETSRQLLWLETMIATKQELSGGVGETFNSSKVWESRGNSSKLVAFSPLMSLPIDFVVS